MYHHFQKRCNVHEERAKKYANTGLFLPIVLMRKGVKKNNYIKLIDLENRAFMKQLYNTYITII